jgi:probable rRNA maturation factor
MNTIDLDNQTNLNVNLDLVKNILLSLTNRPVELVVTNNISIAKLNLEHRDKDKATDVLSFPLIYDLPKEILVNMPLGSIVISADFVKQKAEEFNHSVDDEFSLLFIHGLLHLLGYDHELDSGEMREKERELIELFRLPLSLIVRTEEF